jgi:hypothetical protein
MEAIAQKSAFLRSRFRGYGRAALRNDADFREIAIETIAGVVSSRSTFMAGCRRPSIFSADISLQSSSGQSFYLKIRVDLNSAHAQFRNRYPILATRTLFMVMKGTMS